MFLSRAAERGLCLLLHCLLPALERAWLFSCPGVSICTRCSHCSSYSCCCRRWLRHVTTCTAAMVADNHVVAPVGDIISLVASLR